MSIRLKNVKWDEVMRGSAMAEIAGAMYTIYHMGSTARGFVDGNTRLGTFANLSAAKSACEQHALERIMEAVEVEDDHIRDATKMIEDWYDGDGISTGFVNGIPFRIDTSGADCLLEAYDPVPDKFVTVSYWPTLEAAQAAAVERASHWMPLPQPPKEGE